MLHLTTELKVRIRQLEEGTEAEFKIREDNKRTRHRIKNLLNRLGADTLIASMDNRQLIEHVRKVLEDRE